MYVSLREVPNTPFSMCLVLLPVVIPRENLFHVGTMGELLDDGYLGDACFDSLQGFLVRDAI
jgi:hypothetical protein